MAKRKRYILTNEEKLFLRRRRLELTQVEMAQRLRISVGEYISMEKGRIDVTGGALTLVRLLGNKVEPNEQCLVERRRCSMSLQEVAEDMERCQWWVNQMELGTAPVGELKEYWGL